MSEIKNMLDGTMYDFIDEDYAEGFRDGYIACLRKFEIDSDFFDVVESDTKADHKKFLNHVMQMEKETVDAIPTADVKPVIHARKEHAHSPGGSVHWWVCSNCKKTIDSTDIYCKHCGADLITSEFNVNNDTIANSETVVHGYVVIDEDGDVSCSICGSCFVGNYCRDCGAKLDLDYKDGRKHV